MNTFSKYLFLLQKISAKLGFQLSVKKLLIKIDTVTFDVVFFSSRRTKCFKIWSLIGSFSTQNEDCTRETFLSLNLSVTRLIEKTKPIGMFMLSALITWFKRAKEKHLLNLPGMC